MTLENIETHSVEFKALWKDEYLEWICGFANAEGGTLVIGKNDDGKVIGIGNASKLLEDLPNKIRDVLGIIADIRIQKTQGKSYLEIQVEPSLGAISYKGEFHYRTGTTKQKLKGAALEAFLLRKQGRFWDGIPIGNVDIESLDDAAFKRFKKLAIQSGRMDASVSNSSKKSILEKLNLLEKGQLTRAAILLFHENPERYIPGAFIKIAFFRNRAELSYQDEIHGNLLEQTRQVLDLLMTKYMKAYIHYEGITRVDRYLFPPEALRELILNAIVHRDYGSAVPIQIRVYENELWIFNDAVFSEKMTIESLLASHASKPHNPLIAGAFFRTGDIESWGRGIEKVKLACENNQTTFPEFKIEPTGMGVHFEAVVPQVESSVETQVETQVKTQVKTPAAILEILRKKPEMTLREVAEQIDKSVSAVERAASKLKTEGKIRYVGPQKGGHWVVEGEE